MTNWKTETNQKEKYAAYLCSREWSEKRAAVRERSGGICERCNTYNADHCHHLTYIRKYDERLEDLQDVCEPCHSYIHGHSDLDPIRKIEETKLEIERATPERWNPFHFNILSVMYLNKVGLPEFAEFFDSRNPNPSAFELRAIIEYLYENGIEINTENILERASCDFMKSQIEKFVSRVEAMQKDSSKTPEQQLDDAKTWLDDWEWEKQKKDRREKLNSSNLSEDELIAELQLLIDQERARQGITLPKDGESS